MRDDVDSPSDQGSGGAAAATTPSSPALGRPGRGEAGRRHQHRGSRPPSRVSRRASARFEVEVATVKATQAAQAQADRDRAAENGPRTPLATWIGPPSPSLFRLYVVLDHTQ